MGSWLSRNAAALGAASAIVTALAALAAVIVIPWQIHSADRIQREQTAREIYREFLSLTVNKPELAGADYCALGDGPSKDAYEAYVEYLLYTTEQMVGTDEDWRMPMTVWLRGHSAFICARSDWADYTPAVRDMVEGIAKTACQSKTPCAAR